MYSPGDRFTVNIAPRAHSYYPPAGRRVNWRASFGVFALAFAVMFGGPMIADSDSAVSFIDGIAPAVGYGLYDTGAGDAVPSFGDDPGMDGAFVRPDPRAPLRLNMAGDGRFHAELVIGGTLVDAIVDPSLQQSVAGAELLARAGFAAAEELSSVYVKSVAIEGRSLAGVTLGIARDPSAGTVIGADLLARLGDVDLASGMLTIAAR
ncbi:MAG: hypothetical protein R3C70_19150 [Geminicoccaceae bacterium]